MSDDLVKRLREAFVDFDDMKDAADRIEELEAKLAQQDDLVQAAVAAKLREAVAAVKKDADNDDISQGAAQWVSDTILALITPDAQAALDRAVTAESNNLREALRKIGDHAKMNAYGSSYIICHTCSDTHHAVEAAIRKGKE